ncbi:MAG: hypothetical protein V1858_00790 [Candidatus Gottesmanbacteria bacterium]
MQKLFEWLDRNLLKVGIGFLLFFIPLWPKIPLFDVPHTWVYIRAEDFMVLLVLGIWTILLFTKKVSLKTPLTMPIFLFWIIGAISTIHSILLVFPRLSNVFPNVALLSYIRRIEYMSLFFVAFSAMKDKRSIRSIITVLMITLLLVFGYGVGQKFFGFPAYLTMNEESAKGIAVQLSSQSRISSTFGGHYDLAAYLVLVIPILASMVFGFKNWLVKFSLLITISFGFILLFMTVSRISFFVLLLSLMIMLLVQRKKSIIILSFSVLTIVILLLLTFSPSLLQRFGNTVKEVDILLNSQTGEEIGHITKIQRTDLTNKIIKLKFYPNKNAVNLAVQDEIRDNKIASTAGIISSMTLPPTMPLLILPDAPTGENLPQGTDYINLPLSPIIETPTDYLSKNPKLNNPPESTVSAEFFDFRGPFLIKRVHAYDLSLTTRSQGEWPRAIDAFTRNIIFGSGYSSISLAVDNDYLRLLGESGLLGFFFFIGIFFIIVIYIRRTLPEIESPLERSFVIGFSAGLFGLALNAIFIDVFEASKVAYVLWLLTGITVGVISFYIKDNMDIINEIKTALTSTYAVIIYIFVASILLFSSIGKNYFIGDDFTWLRWAADRSDQSIFSSIINYFTNANGFFYRPGTKLYFLLMYSGFWLNQTIYYMMSILIHFAVTSLFFLISKKILKNFLLSVLAAFLFLILSGFTEVIFWISSVGHLFTVMFILLSLWMFMLWEEKQKTIYFIISCLSIFISVLFHELGVVAPLIIIMYQCIFKEKYSLKNIFDNTQNKILLLTILPYLVIRFFANSHWFNGDYAYNVFKLPFNIVVNIFGYLVLTLLGPASLPIYQGFRNFSKIYPVLGILVSILLFFILIVFYRTLVKKINQEERKIVSFACWFFILALLPFLGLGNIASRYSYLSSVGFILLLVFFMKKLYDYLLVIDDKLTGLAVITIFISIFSLVHLIQIQKGEKDWFDAGEKTKRFLSSTDAVYSDYWTKQKMQLYFVNVPIRQGDAWVFPTGLNDALWFKFRNPNIDVYQMSNVDEALDLIQGLPNEKVFEFDSRGMLIERKKCTIKPCYP